MKTRLFCLLSFALLTLFSLTLTSGAQTNNRELRPQRNEAVKVLPDKSKRWALIIGVDQYNDRQISPLRGAANDAKTLADALIRYAGFPADQVILLTTGQPEERLPTRVNILRRLSNLISTVPKDGLLLLSFAGHGMERDGQAFLLPADAQVSDDINFLKETSLGVTQLADQIKRTGVKQVLLMLDACRNDPLGRADAPNLLSRGFTRGLRFDVINKEVTAFATLYATGLGERAYEYSEKQQGYFTWAVVEGLKGAAANARGEVTLSGLVKYVQETVPKRISIDLGAGKQQMPFVIVEGYKADELVITIVIKTEIDNSATPSPGEQALAIELSFWDTIKTSKNAEDFQAYLRKYPDGQFAELAKIRARELRGDAGGKQVAVEKKPLGKILTHNKSRFIGKDAEGQNRWEWSLFLETDPATRSQIQCVEYTLHKSFTPPVQVVCTPESNFALNSNGWGTFEIKLRVIFKDGTERRLTHQLKFE